MICHGYLVSSIAFNHPECPYCQGKSPSTDGRTACGWCAENFVPSVVPSFAQDLDELIAEHERDPLRR